MLHAYIAQITSATNLSSQEAIWLLEHVAGKKLTQLSLPELTEAEMQKLAEYIDQIATQSKPLAYIIGWVPFLDLRIQVQPPILIPRQETEEWVGRLINELSSKEHEIQRILDIGTGSGVIAIALAKAFPLAQIIAVDINPKALDLAQINAKINDAQNIEFVLSDLFDQLPREQPFDLIVSNPPYIPDGALPAMSESVKKWEDHGALLAGIDGMTIIERIMGSAEAFLTHRPGLPYQLVLEIDQTQHLATSELARRHGFDCKVSKDAFGNWRTAWCKKA